MHFPRPFGTDAGRGQAKLCGCDELRNQALPADELTGRGLGYRLTALLLTPCRLSTENLQLTLAEKNEAGQLVSNENLQSQRASEILVFKKYRHLAYRYLRWQIVHIVLPVAVDR